MSVQDTAKKTKKSTTPKRGRSGTIKRLKAKTFAKTRYNSMGLDKETNINSKRSLRGTMTIPRGGTLSPDTVIRRSTNDLTNNRTSLKIRA